MTELERRVLEMLLAGDDPVLDALRSQLQLATVASREFSGAGLFTNFHLPSETPMLSVPQNFEIGDVSGKLSGKDCGFLLFVRNGAIDFLEGHLWDDGEWPASPKIESLYYMHHSPPDSPRLVKTEQRDFTALRAILHKDQ